MKGNRKYGHRGAHVQSLHTYIHTYTHMHLCLPVTYKGNFPSGWSQQFPLSQVDFLATPRLICSSQKLKPTSWVGRPKKRKITQAVDFASAATGDWTWRWPQNWLSGVRPEACCHFASCKSLTEWLPSSRLQLPLWNEEMHGRPPKSQSLILVWSSSNFLKNSLCSFIE